MDIMVKEESLGNNEMNYKNPVLSNQDFHNESVINCGEFGKCLKKVRRESNTTSDKLGNACGVNPVFIRQIESGTRLPSLPKLVKICDNLQISPAYLLENEIVMKNIKENWSILVEMQNTLSEEVCYIIKDVLHSMIQNLAEPIKKKGEKNGDDTYGMIDKEEFGRRLKKVRQEVHLSSEQLAEACSVNPVFIRQIETGARLPSLSVFVKICNNIPVSPAYLLGNEIKLEITEYGWEELMRIQCDMTPKAQQIVRDVLDSLISNLKGMDKKKE
ncbi:MAG: helix-turn-helix transcriptional regulator [Lachnospiraceae bacterium]|nr:helix-turn-helix transcriptional regulator [Lachnospiraceae bacterium]